MPYLVSYRGLTVTCGDVNDVDRLADLIEGRRPEPAATIGEAVSAMGDSAQRFLRLLLDKPAPVLKSVILKLMGLNDAQFPGLMTGISKPLKSAGLTKGNLLSIGVHLGEPTYSLVPEAIEEVKRGLGGKLPKVNLRLSLNS
jgi:hypothetical protein